jgi:hypothetical protein
MAYATGNPKTKAALKAAVAAGAVRVFSPGPFPAKTDGTEYVEGPQYPEPHRWYATVTVADGVIVKVR